MTYIAVDWGTSNFRAYLLDSHGVILKQCQASKGMKDLKKEQFEPFLMTQIKEWLEEYGACPIVLCGMVGSKQGWLEVPYLDIAQVSVQLPYSAIKVPSSYSSDIYIIQGACQKGLNQRNTNQKNTNQADHFDVMRGEETQIFGFLQSQSDFSGYICLPGTHSKWVKVEKGQCCSFNTFMTGELYNVLSKHSILTTMIDDTVFCEQSFEQGVNQALTHPEQLTTALFSIRANALLMPEQAPHAASFLSGLLIGQEFANVVSKIIKTDQVVFIAQPNLAQLYLKTAKQLQLNAQLYDNNVATVSGLYSVIKALLY